MKKFLGVSLSIAIALFKVNAFALSNSTPAYGDFNTFNVHIKGYGVTNGEPHPFYCNGSLIAEDLVLTSAHCIAASIKQIGEMEIQVGNYITKTFKNGNSLTQYYFELDVIKVKDVFFPKAIDKKIRTGKETGTADINIRQDMVLLVLERPVDKSKVNSHFVSVVTPEEYNEIASAPQNYAFNVVSINFGEEVSNTDTKRYAPMNQVTFNSVPNKVYGLPMMNKSIYYKVEPADSGAPLLVSIGGKWKLIALVRGEKMDQASLALSKMTGKNVRIIPSYNLFTPVSNKICELVTQAGRICR